jgi:hypothetical protein
VHVSVNYNARTDELAYLPTQPEPAAVFYDTLLAEHVAAALTHPRHPQRARFAAVEPSTCPDGAAPKAARLTKNSTATLTWCSCCIHPARPRAPALLASEAFSYVTGTGLGELGLTRYRLFHARLGSMSCKPFGGEIRSEDAATRPTRVTTAAVRQHDVEDGGEEPPRMDREETRWHTRPSTRTTTR